MRAAEFLCLGGVEIANMARTFTYGRNLALPGATFSGECPCALMDEGYDTPDVDPAPWYEPTRPESEDFYGLWAHTINLPSPYGRSVTPTTTYGAHLQPPAFAGQTVEVSGLMYARTPAAMAYGERWLREVLRGSPCNEGNCPTDDLIYLPSCVDDVAHPDGEEYFRTLVDAALVTPPSFSPQGAIDWYHQNFSFVLASSMPWSYHPTERCLDEEALLPAYGGGPLYCSLTTPEWMGDGTFVIDVLATTDLTDLTIRGKVSLDGDCPVEPPGDSVMDCFSYVIPEMREGDRIVIDGMRRKANYIDASDKFATSALSRMTWQGPFVWPDVSICTTVCVTLEVGTGEAVATVDSTLREV